MIWLIVVLYVLAAVLPTIGFVRLLAEARARVRGARRKVAERGYEYFSMEDWQESAVPREGTGLVDFEVMKRREVWCDVVLVGGGLLCGAVASIWSLFI